MSSSNGADVVLSYVIVVLLEAIGVDMEVDRSLIVPFMYLKNTLYLGSNMDKITPYYLVCFIELVFISKYQ